MIDQNTAIKEIIRRRGDTEFDSLYGTTKLEVRDERDELLVLQSHENSNRTTPRGSSMPPRMSSAIVFGRPSTTSYAMRSSPIDPRRTTSRTPTRKKPDTSSEPRSKRPARPTATS